ncbi:MAG: Na+/H+ antiporter NhaC family protein [Lachnospiraceae bacterium]
MAWVLGMFVYFSDSFSPLFVGCTMRSITDKARISREKLAYIADSTSAPVSVLVPITGWAALSGLAVRVGCIATEADGAALFIKAIPFNFYAIIAVLFVGLIASGIVKDFGPMKKAEKRAMEEGKVLADGAEPLTGRELTEMQPYPGFKPRVFLNFVLPVLMIISTALGTYIAFKSAKTMEAFLYVGIFMMISMIIPGDSLQRSNEDHDGRHQGRTARRCTPCHGVLHQRSEQADGNRKLYYFHLRRLHDSSCASRADLCCGSNHGIRDRNLMGNLRDLYAHCSAFGIQLQRR